MTCCPGLLLRPLLNMDAICRARILAMFPSRLSHIFAMLTRRLPIFPHARVVRVHGLAIFPDSCVIGLFSALVVQPGLVMGIDPIAAIVYPPVSIVPGVILVVVTLAAVSVAGGIGRSVGIAGR